MQYRVGKIFGGKGSATDQFQDSLYAITVCQKDHLWAVGDLNIKRYDPDQGLISNWSTTQPGFCVEVADEFVFVGQKDQLQVYNHEGKLQKTWRDPERMGRISAIACHADSVFIADSLDRCIRHYDSNGVFLNNIGKENRMKGFNIPNGWLDFVVDEQGIIHACNPGKHRVERYTADGQLLGHIGRFGGTDPSGFAGCCNPTNVAVDRLGRIYVTEKAGPRAKVYDPEGKLIAIIASDVFDPGCKNMDITIDSLDRAYVIDTVKLVVYQFIPDIISDS
jgi:sugar lactone lactonase YvrE